MIETREMGFMEKIGFIKELNNCVNTTTEFTDKGTYIDTGTVAGNIFIMLACILRQKDKIIPNQPVDRQIDKYCNATFNTLELCQSLSSKEAFSTYLHNKNNKGYIGSIDSDGVLTDPEEIISVERFGYGFGGGGGALAKTRKAKRIKGGSPKKKKTKDKPRVINRIRKSRVKRNYGNKRTRCLVRK